MPNASRGPVGRIIAMPCSLPVSSWCGRAGGLHDTPSSRDTATRRSRPCGEPFRFTVQCAARPRSPIGTTEGMSAESAARRGSRVAVLGVPQASRSLGANRRVGTPAASGSTQLKTTRSPDWERRGAMLPAAAGGSVERVPEHAQTAIIVSAAQHRSMRLVIRHFFRADDGATSAGVRLDDECRVVGDRVEQGALEDFAQGV